MKSAADDVLLAAWEATLQRLPERPAIFSTDGEVARTFAGIEQESRQLEDRLLASVEPGDVVAIQVGNHPTWPALLLACLRRGVVALPIERSISEQERSAAIERCSVAHLITADGDSARIERIAKPEKIDWRDRQPVLLKLTSGTTAAPRAIRFRSEQLLADCVQICDTMGINDRDLNFAVIPISHSYGFSNLLTPLVARGVPMVLSRDRMPRAIIDAIVANEATVFPGMPVFYQALCEMEQPPPLPTLRLCISAGAPLPLDLARRFRSKFGETIHSFYGSSECGGICYDRVGPLVEEGFVGTAMEGVELDAIDDDAESTRIRVRSAAAADSYFPESDEEKLGGGKFVPDDLLAKSDDGYRIVGRVSDLINVAGKKVNPAEVEAELLRAQGVRAAVAFGRSSASRNEEVAACVVTDGATTERELLEHCRQHLSGWQVPKRIFFVNEIAVNERGKVNRRALAEQFREPRERDA
jgi:long-chain acyl-CoA synthetase